MKRERTGKARTGARPARTALPIPTVHKSHCAPRQSAEAWTALVDPADALAVHPCIPTAGSWGSRCILTVWALSSAEWPHSHLLDLILSERYISHCTAVSRTVPRYHSAVERISHCTAVS
jgi:hypothetical protein